jgi:hypothetical protein
MSISIEIFPTSDSEIQVKQLVTNAFIFEMLPELSFANLSLKSLRDDRVLEDIMPLENALIISSVTTFLQLYKQKKDTAFSSEDLIEGLSFDLSEEDLKNFVVEFSKIDFTFSIVSKPTRHPLELKMLVAISIVLARLCKGYITIVEFPDHKIENKLYDTEGFYETMKLNNII